MSGLFQELFAVAVVEQFPMHSCSCVAIGNPTSSINTFTGTCCNVRVYHVLNIADVAIFSLVSSS